MNKVPVVENYETQQRPQQRPHRDVIENYNMSSTTKKWVYIIAGLIAALLVVMLIMHMTKKKNSAGATMGMGRGGSKSWGFRFY